MAAAGSLDAGCRFYKDAEKVSAAAYTVLQDADHYPDHPITPAATHVATGWPIINDGVTQTGPPRDRKFRGAAVSRTKAPTRRGATGADCHTSSALGGDQLVLRLRVEVAGVMPFV
jgi:hypothetical protein